jgi:aminopeptidase
VRFSFRSGRVVGARLRFRGGEVVDAGADEGAEVLLQALETDDGARRLGELGIGCNEGITQHLHNVLFDEKMAGTVHLALGNGFPRLGGTNASALHWDLVTDMRDGELWCDGELVQQGGRWRL